MSRKLVVGLLAAAGTLAVLASAAVGLYRASQHKPAFYVDALAQHPNSAREGSDLVLRQTAAVASDIRRHNRWQALFTADQINGWLAIDAAKNHSTLFPPDVRQPRVAIDNGRLKLAFLWQRSWWSAVVSLEAEIYLREVNVVGVRIRSARAGKLPLPLGDLLNDLAHSGQELGLHVDQQQIDGDPLLIVTFPERDERLLGLEALELRQGEIYLAGGASHGTATPVAARPRDDKGEIAQPDSSKTQR